MEKEEFEAFEDEFDAKDAVYQLWLLGYDENQNIVDWDFLVNESKDPELMVKQAKQYVTEDKFKNRAFPNNVKFLEVLVETVVELDGLDVNVGNLFDEYVEIEEI